MEEWKEYKLGDILNFRRGHDLPKTKMIEGDIPVGGSNGIIGYHNEYTPITPCITIGRSGNVGTPYIYDKCWAHNTVLYIDDFKGNDPKFLYYLLKTLPLSSFGGGSAVPTLNRNHIHPMIVKFCKNLTTQQKIADILSSLDDKIEVNRRINEQLEELAGALFKSWFVDFEPFKDGEFVESELGMIPKGWKVVSLGSLMSYAGGSQPPASEFIDEYKDGYIRFIQIRDYATDSHVTYIPISKRNKLCDVKDIMIARYGASLGRICYGLRGAYNVALAKVTPKYDYYREFLRCYLSSHEFYEGINKKGNRAVQAGFNQGDIDSFYLSFPDNENIIKKFEEISSYLFEMRLHLEEEITHLTTLRDTLLPKLMSGEIKI